MEDMWYIFEREKAQSKTGNEIQLFVTNLMDGFTDSPVIAEIYQQQLLDTHDVSRYGKMMRTDIPKTKLKADGIRLNFQMTSDYMLHLYESADKKIQLVLPERFVSCFNLLTNSEECSTSAFIQGALSTLATDVYWLMNFVTDYMIDLTKYRTDIFRDSKDNPLTLGIVLTFVRLAYYMAGNDQLDEAKALWFLLYGGDRRSPDIKEDAGAYILNWKS